MFKMCEMTAELVAERIANDPLITDVSEFLEQLRKTYALTSEDMDLIVYKAEWIRGEKASQRG